jgi:hypothetical protein
MACETPYRLSARAIPARDTMSAAQRLHPPIAATPRSQTAASKRSETRAAAGHGAPTAGNRAKPQPAEFLTKRCSSRRAARIAEGQEMAALCQRRAFRWADAIREGLDPDIARFVRDQAAAWQLLATSYARSATGAPVVGPADA